VDRVLILSAWEPEIAALRRSLARASARAVARATICRAVGVGAVDAGIGAARAIAEMAPARVLFIGTAGSYPDVALAWPVGAVVLPETFVLPSTAALRGDGYTPAPMVLRESAAPALWAELRRAAPEVGPCGVATSPLAITQTTALARRIARATGAVVENLEVFSVARAATILAVPMIAVLGIANRVGPHAHAEWRRHHLAASKAACAVAWAWLRDRGA
jgi:purine-nucleoside phosphorylase